MGRGQDREGMMYGTMGTCKWRYQLAVRHPSIWYYGVQERDLGWRPRFGIISVERVVETMVINEVTWGSVCSVHLTSDIQYPCWAEKGWGRGEWQFKKYQWLLYNKWEIGRVGLQCPQPILPFSCLLQYKLSIGEEISKVTSTCLIFILCAD